MRKLGLISDTHGFLDSGIMKFLENADEIWHAGDIGSLQVVETIQLIKPLKAVYGNIDNMEIRLLFPKVQMFSVEEVKVFMIHIGGYPGHYEKNIKEMLKKSHAKIFIAGHSHILKVIPDKELKLLHLNPGAAGKSGIHQLQTAMRFEIEGADIRNLEIYEKPRH
jgi:putative phosphoesterase